MKEGEFATIEEVKTVFPEVLKIIPKNVCENSSEDTQGRKRRRQFILS